MSAVADKLREARALIERGWTQRAFWHGDCVCCLGAIERVTGKDFTQSRELLLPLIRVLGVYVPMDIAAWNDIPGRKQDEALWLYDEAIKLVERGK